MISDSIVAQGELILDQSGAVDILINGYRTDKRGRPAPRVALRCLLLGIYLSAHGARSCIITVAYETLTTRVSLETQARLGIRNPDNIDEVVITLDDFYNLTNRFRIKLSWLETEKFSISGEESVRRRTVLETYADAVMDVFPYEWETTTVSIDATGIHSWGRRVSKSVRKKLTAVSQMTDAQRRAAFASDPQLAREWNKRRDLEARWGYKTPKDGGHELFYGYHEHTMVLTSPGDHERGTVPNLIHRFRITPANYGVAETTLDMIDASRLWTTDVLVDRLYNHSTFDSWAEKLMERQIRQHIDLREERTKFDDDQPDGMRWVAGVPHCPATPDELDGLRLPGTKATPAERDTFATRIELRERYAMAAHTQADATGKQRWQCPALAGKVGCPLRAGTVEQAVHDGLPVVASPPNASSHSEMPKCCTQNTVMVTAAEDHRKDQQPHYWGSKKWLRYQRRRAAVEGSYGNRKNPSTENLDRGQNQLFGIVWLYIINTLINASYNTRRLTSWAAQHPDHPNAQHPLLQIASNPEIIGSLHVTEEEYREIMRRREAA